MSNKWRVNTHKNENEAHGANGSIMKQTTGSSQRNPIATDQDVLHDDALVGAHTLIDAAVLAGAVQVKLPDIEHGIR